MQPKAYSYLRFSTMEQGGGDSYRRQTEAAQRWATVNGMVLDETLRMEDRGVSAFRGKNARTGALGAFLRAIEDGEVPEGSYLLVENLDRVSRADPWKAFPQFQLICNGGVTIVTLQDGQTYSRKSMEAEPWRIMASLMVMIRANEESATKGRRVAAAWDHKRAIAADKPMTGVAPAWLSLDRAAGCFRVNDDRAAVVQRIFTMTADGVGLERIAATFNAEGVACFGSAEHWHRSYIAKIVENPAVMGTMTPHKLDHTGGKKVRVPLEPIPNYFPAVVDDATWQAVQAQRLGVRSPRSGSKPAPLTNILAGLARCPECAGTMTRVTKGGTGRAGKPYLVCRKAKAGAGCIYRAVPVAAVEQAILDRFDVIAAVPPAGDDPQGHLLGAVRKELEAVNEAIANLTAAIAAQPLASLVSKLAALEVDRTGVEGRLEAAAKLAVVADPIIRSRRVADLQAALAAEPLDRPRANALLLQCFDSVTIQYEIEWLVFAWKQGGSVSTIPFEATSPARKAA